MIEHGLRFVSLIFEMLYIALIWHVSRFKAPICVFFQINGRGSIPDLFRGYSRVLFLVRTETGMNRKELCCSVYFFCNWYVCWIYNIHFLTLYQACETSEHPIGPAVVICGVVSCLVSAQRYLNSPAGTGNLVGKGVVFPLGLMVKVQHINS